MIRYQSVKSLLVITLISSLFGFNLLTCANSNYSTKQLQPSYKLTIPFTCSGANPAWSLTLNDKGFHYHAGKRQPIRIKPVKPLNAAGMQLDFLRVYKTISSETKQRVVILIKDNSEGCTDGTSLTNHSYDAIVILPHKVLSGCCDMITNG